jgi:hypothetical protein
MRTYRRVTAEDRFRIKTFLEAGLNQSEVAVKGNRLEYLIVAKTLFSRVRFHDTARIFSGLQPLLTIFQTYSIIKIHG